MRRSLGGMCRHLIFFVVSVSCTFDVRCIPTSQFEKQFQASVWQSKTSTARSKERPARAFLNCASGASAQHQAWSRRAKAAFSAQNCAHRLEKYSVEGKSFRTSNNSVPVSDFTWSHSQHSDSGASPPRSTPVLHGISAHSRRRHLRTQPLWAPPPRVSWFRGFVVSWQKVLQNHHKILRDPTLSNFHTLLMHF